MPYIGNSPANVGNYQIVDTIASSFNASTTSFALASGGITITPAKSGQVLVAINGVMQQPDDTGTNGFKVSGSNIVFSSAPASGDTFWAVYQGQNVDIGTPSDDVVDTAHIKDNAITAAKIADGTVVAAEIADNAVTTAKINADAVTGAKIADDAIDSEHIAADSIDAEHLNANSVNTDAIIDDSVTSAHLAAGAVDGTALANDAVDSQHIAADSIDAEHYAAGSVDTTALGADAVTGAKIADDAIDSEHYAAGSIDNEHIADDAINSEHYAADSIDAEHYAPGSVDDNALATNAVIASHITDLNVTTAKIANGAVSNAKLGADAVDAAKIADDSINSEHYVNGSIDHAHLANDCIDGDNIQDDVINSEHYAAASIDNEHLADDAVGVAELSATGTASSSTFLRGDNSWASAGGGKLLQVVQSVNSYPHTLAGAGSHGTNYAMLSSSGVEWSPGITPSASSSKILVDYTIQVSKNNADAFTAWNLQRRIGGGSYTDLIIGTVSGSRTRKFSMGRSYSSGGYNLLASSHTWLDSPNTTTACYYRILMTQGAGSTRVMYVNQTGVNNSEGITGVSTFTFSEIGA